MADTLKFGNVVGPHSQNDEKKYKFRYGARVNTERLISFHTKIAKIEFYLSVLHGLQDLGHSPTFKPRPDSLLTLMVFYRLALARHNVVLRRNK